MEEGEASMGLSPGVHHVNVPLGQHVGLGEALSGGPPQEDTLGAAAGSAKNMAMAVRMATSLK